MSPEPTPDKNCWSICWSAPGAWISASPIKALPGIQISHAGRRMRGAVSQAAGIRNPYMSVNLSRPFRTVPIRGHILLFEPLQSPSFRPDPRSLKAVARRASQEWPSR